MSPKVKAFLNPEIKAKKEVVLKTFGENTSNKILAVVADEDIKLQAFVADICHPLKNQVPGQLPPRKIARRLGLGVWFRVRVRIMVGKQFSSGAIVLEPKNQNTKFAKKNFLHIRNLTLADENCLKSSDIDILIASDYYWHFMKNRKIRGNTDVPVALETKLGYVLSGKLDIGSNGGHQINLNESLVTNVLRVQQELIDPKEQLNEIVQKFWNLESVGVSKNEFDVCENFEADISFANNCYEVKLPFKSEHGILDIIFIIQKPIKKFI